MQFPPSAAAFLGYLSPSLKSILPTATISLLLPHPDRPPSPPRAAPDLRADLLLRRADLAGLLLHRADPARICPAEAETRAVAPPSTASSAPSARRGVGRLRARRARPGARRSCRRSGGGAGGGHQEQGREPATQIRPRAGARRDLSALSRSAPPTTALFPSLSFSQTGSLQVKSQIVAGDSLMAAPRKGTATPLRAVFSPEETKRAVARVVESVADRRAELGRLQGFVADNAALVSLVNRLPDELSHEIMVPFGGAAFFPGRLIHTNELMVLLGEGYYAQRSAKQTTDILHRRGVELEAQVEAMKATISDLEAEAKFFESTAAEASEGLVEIREEYDEDTESNSSKSEASVATEGMSDKEKEHARIMARLDELEMEEMEAGSTSEEEQDDDDNEDEDDGGVVTSEDGEENEESGNALCDGNEYNSSSSGASFSGIGGNDRIHGSIQLKSALKKPGGEEVLRGISQAPSAHTSHSITKSEVRVRKAVSFEDDKHVVGSSKSPSLPLDPAQPAPGFKGSSDPAPSRERKIISSGRQAFTGSIVERDDNLLPIQPPVGISSAKPGTSASSRPMSRFKMQKGER